MKEIWKAIDWMEHIPKDKYLISNLGNVYNNYRDNYVKQRFIGNQKKFQLKLFDKENNRIRVVQVSTALIVAIAFIPFPDGYSMDSVNQLFVHHKDNCSTNNRADNLEWCINLKNEDTTYVTVEAMYTAYELLLKYCNNRTWYELSDIIHNETGIRLNRHSITAMRKKVHGPDSIIGKHFGLIGTSIEEEANKKEKLLRPIVAAALRGDFIKHPDEQWVWLDYPGIKKERYIISNYGRILNKDDEEISVHVGQDGHYKTALMSDKNNNKQKLTSVPRLIAYHFCNFPKGIEERELENIIVKYKDGNSENIKYSNLYWTTHQGGTKLGIEVDQIRDIINYVRQLSNKGYSVPDIMVLTNHKFNVNYTKSKYQTMISRTREVYDPTYETLDVDCRKLRKRGTKKQMRLSDEEVELICERIVEFNGNCVRVFESVEDDIPDIGLHIITHIRNGEYHTRISEKYFKPGEFKNRQSTPIEVYTMDGVLVKKFDSIKKLSMDSDLIPAEVTYTKLCGRFSKRDRLTIGEYTFQKVDVNRKSRKGKEVTVVTVDVIAEMDENDNILSVYYGRRAAREHFGFKTDAAVKYYLDKDRPIKNADGHYLKTLGKKTIPFEDKSE